MYAARSRVAAMVSPRRLGRRAPSRALEACCERIIESGRLADKQIVWQATSRLKIFGGINEKAGRSPASMHYPARAALLLYAFFLLARALIGASLTAAVVLIAHTGTGSIRLAALLVFLLDP